MKRILILFFALYALAASPQACNALFSFSAYFDKVLFHNQSTVSNAHYYWNFGDGSSSNFKDPIHYYPGKGNYLVTLYVHDTINNCSNYYETWINALKVSNSLAPCAVDMTDSIWYNTSNGYYYLKIVDLSSNCNGLIKSCYSVAGGGGWYPIQNIGTYPLICPSWVFYSDGNTSEIAVKTTRNLFSPFKNYTSCSANFEFKTISITDTTHRILFKAMNRNASSYHWYLTGFGDPIESLNDTVSASYIASPQWNYNVTPKVYLFTVDQNGCRDSMIQTVALRSTSVTVVGVSENIFDNISLTLFPNPTKEKLQLKFEQGKLELDRITITNVLGQSILVQNNQKEEIDVRSLEGSVYFLIAQIGDRKKVFKFIKE